MAHGQEQGHFFIFDKGGAQQRGHGKFSYREHIARSAWVPDPPPSKLKLDESWLVIYTGVVPIFLASPNGAHQWEGDLFLFLDGSPWLYEPKSTPRAVRYNYSQHGGAGPQDTATVERQKDVTLPFEEFPFVIAISGTNESEGATYGVGPELARIEPYPAWNAWVPATAPGHASMRAGLAVWGDGATLSSVAFQLTVTAEYLRH